MFDDDFEDEARREREENFRLATHDQDLADNLECLALAVDLKETKRRLVRAYEEKDNGAWQAWSEHFRRLQAYIKANWPGLPAAIERGDFE